MLKPIVSWVLIADAERARIIADDGTGEGLRQLPDAVLHAKPGGENSDDEGRTMNRISGGRTRLERHVEHPPEAEAFAVTLVKRLDAALRQGQFDRWAVCAAPAMLGLIRHALDVHASAPLRDALRDEISKELINVPTDDLAPHLAAMVPP